MLIRNTFYNLLGLGLPLLVAVVSMPVLIHHLGDARFGVLTLIWAVVSYFGLFDLGLGRALTQQLAVLLSQQRDAEIPGVIYSGLVLLTVLGAFAGLSMWFGAGQGAAMVSYDGDRNEIRASIQVMAVAMPSILLTSGLRGVLEARMAFKMINLIRLPMGLFTFLGPLAAVLWLANDLVLVTVVLTAGRVVACIAHAYFASRSMAGMFSDRRLDRATMRSLLASGGWMTVTNIVSPLMTFLDRFLISATISAAAVAYYVTPNEMITKLWIIPGALTAVLFPKFSIHITSDNHAGMVQIYRRSVLYLALIIAPLTLLFASASKEVMTLWLGAAFAAQSEVLLKVFCIGVLLNSLSQIPFSLLQGNGRSHLTAKVHLLELPFYCALLWVGCHYFGLAGAGAVWLIRIAVDCGLMFYYSMDVLKLRFMDVFECSMLVFLGMIAVAFGLAFLPDRSLRLVAGALSLTIISIYAWRTLVSAEERVAVLRLFRMRGWA